LHDDGTGEKSCHCFRAPRELLDYQSTFPAPFLMLAIENGMAIINGSVYCDALWLMPNDVSEKWIGPWLAHSQALCCF
jgi:hypothetical protein